MIGTISQSAGTCPVLRELLKRVLILHTSWIASMQNGIKFSRRGNAYFIPSATFVSLELVNADAISRGKLYTHITDADIMTQRFPVLFITMLLLILFN